MKTMKDVIYRRFLNSGYIHQYEAYLYWIGQINCCGSDTEACELAKHLPDSEIHKNTLKKVLDDLYAEFEGTEWEDEVEDAKEAAVKEAQKIAASMAEEHRQADGIFLKD